MPFTDDAKELMLWHFARNATHASLHDGLPAVETELRRDIYQRRAIDIKRAENGVAESAKRLEFDIPPGAAFDHLGMWNAPSGGVLLGAARLKRREEFRGRGVYVIDLVMIDLNLDERVSKELEA